MKIKEFSQIGKRANNEDFRGFNENLITVCDGMGGHTCGERASRFVVETMLKKFEQPIEGLNEEFIQQKLQEVQCDINEILKTEPQLEKMGTTFTGIFKTPKAWYVAHIGDSRVYLYRPNEGKLWHTWDQSLVGFLMKDKQITREAGRFHPMSNRIDRAIIANSAGKTHKAEVVKFDQLQAGDIFMLCSDGVVEAWGDLELVNLFKDTSLTFEQKVEKLAQQCNEKSRDNNTAIVVELDENDALTCGKNDAITWIPFKEIEDDYAAYLQKQKEDEEREKMPPPPPPQHPMFAQQTSTAPMQSTQSHKPQQQNSTGDFSKKISTLPTKFWLLICGILLAVILFFTVIFFILRAPQQKINEPAKNNVEQTTPENSNDDAQRLRKKEKVDSEEKYSDEETGVSVESDNNEDDTNSTSDDHKSRFNFFSGTTFSNNGK